MKDLGSPAHSSSEMEANLTLDGAFAPAPEVASLDGEALFRDHVHVVGRWAARLGGPALQGDAEDIVQEVFEIALKKLPRFRGDAKVSTWLYAITHKVVHGRRRRQHWRRLLGRNSDDALGSLPDERPHASEQMETLENRVRVYDLLDTLPERQRTALILSELEGLSGEEVAELMDAKPATVFVWIHRAKARLAAQLFEEEGA